MFARLNESGGLSDTTGTTPLQRSATQVGSQAPFRDEPHVNKAGSKGVARLVAAVAGRRAANQMRRRIRAAGFFHFHNNPNGGCPMAFAVSRALEPDDSSPLDSADRKLVLIRGNGDSDQIPPVQLRAENAAHQLGVHVSEIERLPFDLSALEDEGAFVNVDASNFGLLDRRLDWRSLGVTLPKAGDLAFRPPRCGLVPDRYRLPLLRPASRAHVALQRYSYHFRLVETVFESPSYRWVPWRAWPRFEQEFSAAQARLRSAQTIYERDFDTIRDTVVATFRQLAADSVRRLNATGHVVAPDFEDAVVEEVLEVLPTPEVLWQKLMLRYRVGVMLLGSEMLAEQYRAAQERRDIEAIEAERRLGERDAEAKERAIQERLWAEQERIRGERRADQEELRREAEVKERLRQLKLDAAKERLQDILSPLQDGAQQLHAAVFDAATAIRASLQKHNALRGSSARKARELSRWFRAMNWAGDDELETLVHELEQLATTPPSKKRKRNPGPIDRVLSDIISLTYENARAVAEPSRMAALEL